MSPASQGALEVERYIGSCLISSSVRPGSHKLIAVKKQEPVIRGKTRACYAGQNYGVNNNEQCQIQYGHNGWTGAPLISITSSPRRCNQRSSSLIGQQQPPPQSPQQHQATDQVVQQVPVHLHKSPLSRLAIHTQGTPLILAGKFPNRGKLLGSGNASGSIANSTCSPGTPGNYAVSNNAVASMMNGGANNATRCPPSRPQRPGEPVKKQQQQQQQVNPKADCPGGKDAAGTSIANIDSLSIASDESSGSNNSENSLPRIIKPRKRRKKDRKPPNNVVASMDITKHEEQQQQQQQQPMFSTVSLAEQQSNLVGMKTYMPACYEQQHQQQQHHQQHPQQHQHQQQQQQQHQHHRYEGATAHLRNHRRPPLARESGYACRTSSVAGTASLHEIADVRQRYPYRHVEVKVLDDNRNVVVAAPVRGMPGKLYRHNPHHHLNNASNNLPRYMHDYNAPVCEEGIKDGLRSCQCRYCDPAALIWDVDQNCYSPFLTPTSANEMCASHFPQIPLYVSRPVMPTCQEQVLERLFDVEKSRHHHLQERGAASSGVVLRRSWSDPTSYFSEEIVAPSKDVGVIGDRGQSEGGKRRTLWRGDSIGIPAGNIPANSGPGTAGQTPSKGLEVSTEIITSPNGHRDLEIKFYSPSPCTPGGSEDDKANSEEADEEGEDLSDIWSYHESKLQQDFRTLLQAEE